MTNELRKIIVEKYEDSGAKLSKPAEKQIDDFLQYVGDKFLGIGVEKAKEDIRIMQERIHSRISAENEMNNRARSISFTAARAEEYVKRAEKMFEDAKQAGEMTDERSKNAARLYDHIAQYAERIRGIGQANGATMTAIYTGASYAVYAYLSGGGCVLPVMTSEEENEK